jgi:hypothetical protein
VGRDQLEMLEAKTKGNLTADESKLLSQMLGMTRTPAGRIEIYEGLRFRSWPVMSRLAKLHRKTLAKQTKIVAIVGSIV